MGLGSCTLSTVPSPHMPWSFQPHDTATPSAAPGKGVDEQREERVEKGEGEGERGRGRRREEQSDKERQSVFISCMHVQHSHIWTALAACCILYISHTALLALSSTA